MYFQQQRLNEALAGTKEDSTLPWLAQWLTRLPATISAPELPLAWQAGGINPAGIFRTSWTDSNALYLAFKGGQADHHHGHMDAGAFVLDALGVRWAWDLGAQDYLSIESKGWKLWDFRQTGDRWRIYRINNFSHNTLTLGGQLHNAAGRAEITAFATNAATVDLSPVFRPQAKSVFRHFEFHPGQVRIRDDIKGATNGLSVCWQMLTRADITLQGDTAVLRQDGEVLQARILSPAGARFNTASSQPPEDGVNKANPGFALLQVNTRAPASGKLSVEIELQPRP